MYWHRTLESILAVAIAASLGAAASAALTTYDATSDAFGVGAIQHDIVSVTSTINPANVVFEVEFADPIAPASSFLPHSLVGFLDLDVDQNSATGASARFGSPPSATVVPGVEFYVDLFSEASSPGMVDVIDASTGLPTGSAAISFGATLFSLTLPFSLIGGDDGALRWGLVVGTFAEPTDQATGSTVSGVPEPASVAGWLALATAALLWSFQRRRCPS
jgi:hypothetical protein